MAIGDECSAGCIFSSLHDSGRDSSYRCMKTNIPLSLISNIFFGGRVHDEGCSAKKFCSDSMRWSDLSTCQHTALRQGPASQGRATSVRAEARGCGKRVRSADAEFSFRSPAKFHSPGVPLLSQVQRDRRD